MLLFTMSSAFAQDHNPGNNPIDGILGKYLLQEKWDFLDKVVVRVMGTAPAWIPGKCDNVPVSAKYSMPVSFSLSD